MVERHSISSARTPSASKDAIATTEVARSVTGKASPTDGKEDDPNVVDHSRCLARVWNDGLGGQCKKASDSGLLCAAHAKADKWRSYGRVDDPIRTAMKDRVHQASGAVQARAKDDTRTKRKEAPAEVELPRKLSKHEKLTLQEKLDSLSEDQLQRLMHGLGEQDQDGSEEVSVDIDCMPPKSQRRFLRAVEAEYRKAKHAKRAA